MGNHDPAFDLGFPQKKMSGKRCRQISIGRKTDMCSLCILEKGRIKNGEFAGRKGRNLNSTFKNLFPNIDVGIFPKSTNIVRKPITLASAMEKFSFLVESKEVITVSKKKQSIAGRACFHGILGLSTLQSQLVLFYKDVEPH